MLTVLAWGMWQGLIFFYVDGYLGLGAQFAQMFLIAFFVGLVVAPILGKLGAIIGKKTCTAIRN